MRRMRTTGQIAKLFYEADSGTIIRKPNMRRFAKDNGVFYHILSNTSWIIDLDEFLEKVNPNNIDFHIEFPRLRNIATSVILFNETYPEYDIDKHTVEKCMRSDSVTVIRHGNRWIINYDELESEMLKYLSVKNKKCDK